MPRVGDMIVETCAVHNTQHAGIVYDIVYDKYGHQQNVLIEWPINHRPHNYSTEHGYSGVNIHNIRDRFKVVRDGVDIP